MKRFEEDVRKVHISTDCGAEELSTYLQWLADCGLPDTEKSFVEFAVLRSGAEDVRHFLEGVKRFVPLGPHGQPEDRMRWLKTMRLFLNPTSQPWDDPAHAEIVAGYFDTLQAIYTACADTSGHHFDRPTFKLEGASIRPRT